MIGKLVSLKQFISEKEYEELNQLEELCFIQDKTNLKLELDYKLSMRGSAEIGAKEINEFLYYVNDSLVAYLGISSYGGSNIAEINGMTHPDFRRKGIFKKLFEHAILECQKRNFTKILLLSDGNSKSGVKFINSVKGDYDFSEYRMKFQKKSNLENINSIGLRKAEKRDGREIERQNVIFTGHSQDYDWFLKKEEELNIINYMVEFNGKVIGKLKVNYSGDSAFISGVGILPEYRSKGYGKAALKEAIRLINGKNIYDIELDVESKNKSALNLYKACGFQELSVMNYYKYNI